MPHSSLWLEFCYGHRLLNYDGKCRHLHGHSARAELQLSGAVSSETSESAADPQSQIESWVMQELDSRMILCRQDPALEALRELGEPVFVIDANPTTENLARLLFERGLELGLPLAHVRLWESPRCSATYSAAQVAATER